MKSDSYAQNIEMDGFWSNKMDTQNVAGAVADHYLMVLRSASRQVCELPVEIRG